MGINKQRLVSPVPSDQFLCRVCEDVVEEPMQAPCHHSFCLGCVSKIPSSCDASLRLTRKCPDCHLEFTEDQLVPWPRLKNNILGNLSIHCINQHLGCKEPIRLEAINEHLCEHSPVPCPNPGCKLASSQMVLSRSDLEVHKSQCEWRPLNCQHGCGATFPAKHRLTHEQNCVRRPVDCPQRCECSIPAQDVQNHIEVDRPKSLVKCLLEGCEFVAERGEAEQWTNHLARFQQSHSELILNELLRKDQQVKHLQQQLNQKQQAIKRAREEKDEEIMIIHNDHKRARTELEARLRAKERQLVEQGKSLIEMCGFNNLFVRLAAKFNFLDDSNSHISESPRRLSVSQVSDCSRRQSMSQVSDCSRRQSLSQVSDSPPRRLSMDFVSPSLIPAMGFQSNVQKMPIEVPKVVLTAPMQPRDLLSQCPPPPPIQCPPPPPPPVQCAPPPPPPSYQFAPPPPQLPVPVSVITSATTHWTPLPDMDSKRHGCCSASGNNSIIVAGGFDDTSALQTAMTFNFNECRWFSLPDMLSKRAWSAAVFGLDRFFVIGGCDGQGQCLKTVEMLDLTRMQWCRLPEMQQPREGCVAALVGAQLIVCGGFDGHEYTNTVEVLNLATMEWSSVPPMHHRRGACAIACWEANEKVFVMGGSGGNGAQNSAEVLDVSTWTWTLLPSMKSKRVGAGGAFAGGHVVALGGSDTSQYLDSVEALDLNTMTWVDLPSMSCRRIGCAAALSGRHLVALGGSDTLQHKLDTAEVLQWPFCDTFSS